MVREILAISLDARDGAERDDINPIPSWPGLTWRALDLNFSPSWAGLVLSGSVRTPIHRRADARQQTVVRAMRQGFVCILTNKPYGTLYIGMTSNLPERLTQHRKGTASGLTKKYGLARLVYYEVHELVTTAIARESSLKRWKREWKIALIERDNPTWRELDYTLV